MNEVLIRTEKLNKLFPVKGHKGKTVKAVTDVSLNIYRGRTLGVVGESGSGKSTLGRLILRLIEPTSGECFYGDKNVYSLSRKELNLLREKMQIVFQDPFSSLNPRQKIGSILWEPLVIHNRTSGLNKEKVVGELLNKVGLGEEAANRYPHEFSGGQRQRIAIARALALKPEFVVCDEPVSALDVSIQSQIINLLEELRQKENITYMFIAHGLNVVRHISDYVAVMYLGEVVEYAAVDDLFSSPLHPYTKMLIGAAPEPDPRVQLDFNLIQGEIPSPIDPPPGCRFHTRCRYATEACRQTSPPVKNISEDRWVRCHLYK
ncbi:oligopeptide/dipeptide ABC transporter ATPase [Thermincola ferriacetica]|uniref:Oligopeptide/dipeptide ABC transporter, ATPase subunit n=2 Tax=Thermincola TaxID=278993 RepID=D5XE87_THEPJ|nr:MULTISPECIES: oligopeptide/dipeptide ABC transporter ATP-binding protein [Thermincola]ADG81958.1 oligopeptide/dipeptide ABC transporter, ATPase subunit [Thermincola potens JR]KNZ70977.1 oligopeptide/dipeptide ABC transporter ATPase [Thermincola ferriacetica]